MLTWLQASRYSMDVVTIGFHNKREAFIELNEGSNLGRERERNAVSVSIIQVYNIH